MKIGAKLSIIRHSEKPKLDTYEVANFDLGIGRMVYSKSLGATKKLHHQKHQISSQNSQGQDSVTNSIFADCSKPNDYVKYDEK